MPSLDKVARRIYISILVFFLDSFSKLVVLGFLEQV